MKKCIDYKHKWMEEAACIDGANIWQTFFLIIMPLVGPATMTIAIYVFLSAWNEFLLANVLVVPRPT